MLSWVLLPPGNDKYTLSLAEEVTLSCKACFDGSTVFRGRYSNLMTTWPGEQGDVCGDKERIVLEIR